MNLADAVNLICLALSLLVICAPNGRGIKRGK